MSDAPAGATSVTGDEEACPVCGMTSLVEIKCKVVCTNCRTIVKSCADL